MCIRSIGKMEPPQRSFIGGVPARDLPFLPPQEADAEIRKYHVLVKELVEEKDELARRQAALKERNAILERVIKAICRGCALRLAGSCDWLCPGRDYCDTGGLRVVDLTTQQEVLCGSA